MSDPQLQYNNIIHVLVFRWRNDWLVGLQAFFFFFLIRIVEGQNRPNAECQCEENDRNIQIQEPRLRPEKKSYTGITYFKILGQSVVFFLFLFVFFLFGLFCFCFVLFCFFVFYLCLNMLKYSLDNH